jgi:hypothetical protein
MGSGKPCSGAVRFVAFTTQDRPSDLRLKRDLIVLAAIVADYLETLWRVGSVRRFLGTTLCTTLRSHHVALVEYLLFLLCKQESFLALNARGFDVRHMIFSLNDRRKKGDARILAQVRKDDTNRSLCCKRSDMRDDGLAEGPQVIAAF